MLQIGDWIRLVQRQFKRAGTCDLRISLQGRYPSVVDLSAFRIRNTAVTMHGSTLLQGPAPMNVSLSDANGKPFRSSCIHIWEGLGLSPGRHHSSSHMEPHHTDPSDSEKQISFRQQPRSLRNDPPLQAELTRAYIRRIIVGREGRVKLP
jgi:hypothetical protein